MKGGLWRDALAELRANRTAMAALGVLAFLTIAAIAGPAFLDYGEEQIDWANIAAMLQLLDGARSVKKR